MSKERSNKHPIIAECDAMLAEIKHVKEDLRSFLTAMTSANQSESEIDSVRRKYADLLLAEWELMEFRRIMIAKITVDKRRGE